jgi:hypothetical protein
MLFLKDFSKSASQKETSGTILASLKNDTLEVSEEKSCREPIKTEKEKMTGIQFYYFYRK